MQLEKRSGQIAYFSRIFGLVLLLGFTSYPSCEQNSHTGRQSGKHRELKEVEQTGLEWIQGDVAFSMSGSILTVITPIGIDMFTLNPQDTMAVRNMTPNQVYGFLVKKAAGDLIIHSISFWNSEAADSTPVRFPNERIARLVGVSPRIKRGVWTATVREVAVAQALNGSVEDAKRSLADPAKDPELTSFLEGFLDGTFSNVVKVSLGLIPRSVRKTVTIATGRTIEFDAIGGRPEVLRQVRALAREEMMGKPAVHI